MDGALAVTTFYLYDRWDNQIGTVMGAIEARRSWTLNGEHLLTIRTPMPLSKGQRVVYSDTMGKYREFIVSETTESDESGVPVTVATCEDSIAELLGDFLVEKEPNGSAMTCLNSALSSSRWVAGTVDVAGTKRLSFYHCSARQAVNDVAEAFGAELSTTIEVSGSRIAARKVNLTTRVGADNGARFTCRKGLQHVERTVLSDDVCTRLYGYGKSLECTDAQGNATGGFSRKLDFASVNGGKEYVESASALQVWGRPNGSGGKAHVDGIVEFPDCEDKAELKALTIEELERRSVPKVSYSATLTTLQAAGLGARGVGDGDTVAIVDENFDPPLRLSGRCLAIDENLLDRTDTVVTLGNIVGTVADSMLVQQQGLASLSSHAASWDGAAQVSSSYINAILSRLNEEFDAGGSYKYESFEAGTIYSSVPLDENLKPTSTPATAMQLSGLGLRIASGVKSNGEFDWRTFGTGAGFTADVINAGTIRGGSSHWNLETGDLELKNGKIDITGTLGGKQVRTVISPSLGFRILADNAFIGGIEVVNGSVHMRAQRCGTSAANYMTTGTTDEGYAGTSLVSSAGNYFSIAASYAVDDASKATTGTNFYVFDKRFLTSSRYYMQTVMCPPVKDIADKSQTQQHVAISQTRAQMVLSSSRGLFIDDGSALLMFDATHYVRIDGNGVQCRCGSRGFGWKDGKFSELAW